MTKKKPSFQIDEKRIQHAIFIEFLSRGHKVIIPNISWSYLPWEADMISVTKANYLHEFEIKISKPDFERDFDKFKHRLFRSPNLGSRTKIPNYFWYVAPIKAIPLCVPIYAGLIEVVQNSNSRGKIGLVHAKKPKRLHNTKIDDAGIFKMMRTMMFKFWGLSKVLEKIKIQRGLWADYDQ